MPYSTRKLTAADIGRVKAETGKDHGKRLDPYGKSYHSENCVIAVEKNGMMVGSTAVLFARPGRWPDIDDGLLLPELRSLGVMPEHHTKGAGTFLINAVIDEVKLRGHRWLHLSVDREENAGAYRLYHRLGFEAISENKGRYVWSYTDEKGDEQEVVKYLIDMVKRW